MAKKVSAKSAAKKTAKKAVKKSAVKAVKKTVQETPVLQEQTPALSVSVPAAEVTAAPAEIAPAQAPAETPSEPVPDNSTSSTVVEESTPVQAQTEEKDMADENKGVGKEYNASEFSQPATEAGAGNSKVYLYVGISVVVLAVIVGGLFFLGGFAGKGSDSSLTGSTITAYCSDTDGGYNRFTKGVAQGIYYLDYSSGEFMDYCEDTDENKLTEYYCKNDLVVYTTEPCPDGLKCQEGICA